MTRFAQELALGDFGHEHFCRAQKKVGHAYLIRSIHDVIEFQSFLGLTANTFPSE
jgi:hypothetical protein